MKNLIIALLIIFACLAMSCKGRSSGAGSLDPVSNDIISGNLAGDDNSANDSNGNNGDNSQGSNNNDNQNSSYSLKDLVGVWALSNGEEVFVINTDGSLTDKDGMTGIVFSVIRLIHSYFNFPAGTIPSLVNSKINLSYDIAIVTLEFTSKTTAVLNIKSSQTSANGTFELIMK